MAVAPGAAVPAVGGIVGGGALGTSSGFVQVDGAAVPAVGALSAGTATGSDSGNRVVGGASVAAAGFAVGGTGFGGGSGFLLPGLAPAVRDFVMDEYPLQLARMRNGRSHRWSQSNMAAGASFNLEWKAVTNAEAEEILKAWDASYGLYGDVALSQSMLAGLSLELQQFMASPSAMVTWRFSEPPTVTFLKAGRCTVRVRLKSRRVSVMTLPPAVSYTVTELVPCCTAGSVPA